MKILLKELKKELQKLGNPQKAKFVAGYFKTGKGEYGEGDIFLGITVPVQRTIAKKYPNLSMNDLQELLNSKIHEERLISLMILSQKYKKANNKEKKEFFDFYLENTHNINNWDLIDLSSRDIVGDFLIDKDKKILYKLAKSKSTWEKRIAIIATNAFIRIGKFKETFKIAEILLNDSHDLIHKAVGWMLREVGNRDQKAEEEFLKKHYQKMPRTMLRYAIEKFAEKKRKFYLAKT